MLANLELRQWTLGTQCTNERANRGSPKCPGDYVLHPPPLSPSSISLVKLANYRSAHLCFPYTLKFLCVRMFRLHICLYTACMLDASTPHACLRPLHCMHA